MRIAAYDKLGLIAKAGMSTLTQGLFYCTFDSFAISSTALPRIVDSGYFCHENSRISPNILITTSEIVVNAPDDGENIWVDTDRVLSIEEAAKEWDLITKLSLEPNVVLPFDLEDNHQKK